MVHLLSDDESSFDQEGEEVKSEDGVLNDPPRFRNTIEGNLATSSRTKLKSYFVGMGFSPALVDKALEKNGEGNVELLLESLFAYSAIEEPAPDKSGLSDGIFSQDFDENSSGFSIDGAKMENLDAKPEIKEDKRACLLTMNFAVKAVDFAIDRLGEDAQVHELVDFIVASQIAESSGKNEESLPVTTDRTFHLLEMGFTENEISSAIERYGSDVSVQELADSIFAKRFEDTCPVRQEDELSFPDIHDSNSKNGWTPVERINEDDSKSNGMHGSQSGNGWTSVESLTKKGTKRRSFKTLLAETDHDFGFKDIVEGKKPKLEYDDYSTFRPKSTSYSMPFSHKEPYRSAEEPFNYIERPQKLKSNHPRLLPQSVAKPPYFFYGNVLDVSNDAWTKISQFLYAVAPEFVNTHVFSALNRKEGYIHNLPRENRSHILPRPGLAIADALPETKPWWPSWDARKQLSSICSETKGVARHCERIRKVLIDSRGFPSKEQKTDIIRHCETLNLVWVGRYKLSPMGAEQVERILGYAVGHTEMLKYDPLERITSLKYSFQTDTLGYHLSVLKRIFPQGLTMLSLYSGIGGAEVALHRLGIRLKCVVSVDASETNRKILKRWWVNTGQTGKLVQIEHINKMKINKIESLVKDFGVFDLVICQNPCTCISENGKMTAGLDFSMFYEFVRVLQRVRSPSIVR